MTGHNSDKSGGRLLSLDALRGFDMIWIMGLAMVVRTVCSSFPDGGDSWVAQQVRHAPWGGFSFYDLIFPLFLFMSGMSFPFSFASQVKKGVSLPKIHWRMFKRMMMLVLLSMVHCGVLQFDPAKYNYVSVLQRIGITGFLAGLLYVHLRSKGRIIVAAGIVAAFWALLEFVPSPLAPEGAGAYAKRGNIVDWMDGFVSLRSWFGRDPFEIRDIPLSVVQVPIALLGMFTADIVRDGKFSQCRRVIRIAVIGAVLVVLGVVCVVLGCPLIKNLSTPSFMFLSGGLCMMLFAFFYWIVDVKGIAAWCYPLRVVGMNALMAYLMQTIIPIPVISRFFFGGIASLSGIPNVVNSIGYLAVCWLILYFLHRQKVYLKV